MPDDIKKPGAIGVTAGSDLGGQPQQVIPHGAPSALENAFGAVKQTLEGAQAAQHDAYERAKQGDYSGLSDLAINAAMSGAGGKMNILKNMAAKDAIGVGAAPSQLTGKGTEYLQDAQGNVIAKFYNGQLMQDAAPVGNVEPTAPGFAHGGHVEAVKPLPSAVGDPNMSQPPQAVQPLSGGIDIYDISGAQPVLGSMHPDDVTQSVMAGTHSLPASSKVDVLSPDGELGSIPAEDAPEAFKQGFKYATPQLAKEAEYGTGWQQALAAVEGAARGISFGASSGLETLLGVDPKGILARQEVNPIAAAGGEMAGLVGSAFIPVVGEANILAKGGQMAARGLGLGAKGAGVVSQVAAATVRGAFEGALFQGGEEVHKAFTQDPNQTAETAIAHMGLGAVLGGVFGGTVGAAAEAGKKALGAAGDAYSRFISQVDRPKLEAGDFVTAVEHHPEFAGKAQEMINDVMKGLKEKKPDAAEIEAAAKRLGAPVLEGMVSGSKLVQKAEDSLINGVPTYSGVRRAKLYNEVYSKGLEAIDSAVGPESAQYSKAELGNIFKGSIKAQLEEQAKPISALYDEIRQTTELIPLAEKSAEAVAKNLSKIQEFRVAPSSAEGKMVRRVMNEVRRLKTVDDVKVYKSTLSVSPTASSGEKRMAGLLRDALTELEDNSIEKFARQEAFKGNPQIAGLIEAKEAANKAYKPFIRDVGTLMERLGKGKVYGIQDALHFMENLTPEEVVQKLFSKKDSEFLSWFGNKFPAQMQMLRDYQIRELRDVASKTGTLSPKVLFNNINKLEPEIQKALFNKQQLQSLSDAETVIRSIPANFNPSGTANMDAFRQFFEHPTGALVANARDVGIEKFIQAVGQSPEVSNARKLADITVKGWNATTNAVKSVFDKGKEIPTAALPALAAREKLAKLVEEHLKSPEKLFEIGANNPLAEYASSFSQASARALQYLSSQRPNTQPGMPFDSKIQPNDIQKAAYNRALTVAQQPMAVLGYLKEGTLTPQDVIALKTMYPGYYETVIAKVGEQVMKISTRGEPVPYQIRLGLSLLMGQPLDSTMTPGAIQAAQGAHMMNATKQQQAPQGGQPTAKGGQALAKLPGGYQTPGQARAQRALKQ